MQRFIIILAAAVAGILVYFAIAPNLDNNKSEREPTDQQISNNRPTTTQEAPATSSESKEADVPVTAEEAELSGETRYPVMGTAEHTASGEVLVIQYPDEQLIRFEDYDGSAGPELHVYLATDRDATEYVDLGPARATSGNINYGVPLDVDIDAYDYVLTWSEADDELYDFAKIN